MTIGNINYRPTNNYLLVKRLLSLPISVHQYPTVTVHRVQALHSAPLAHILAQINTQQTYGQIHIEWPTLEPPRLH